MRRFFHWLVSCCGLNFHQQAQASVRADEAIAAKRGIIRSWLNSDH